MNSQYLNIIDRSDCTGCGACSAVCPHKCISVIEDKNGFLYPEVDLDSCINCNLCKKVCPILIYKEKEEEFIPLSVFAAKNANQNIAKVSSSGGVFSVFAENILEEGGTVYGVELSEELEAHHIRIENISELDRIRGSKYLQSRASEVFPKVKEDLKAGLKVLFSGTPCQIAGLKRFLGKIYEGLLCVEVVCHGVPSESSFREYRNFVGKKYHSEVESINFRDKRDGWQDYRISTKLKNGRSVSEKRSENLYMLSYLGNLFVKDCCTTCHFKSHRSTSDITLGDMWGIESILPGYDQSQGVSMIAINTNAGKIAFEMIADRIEDCKEVPYGDVLRFNPCIQSSCRAHPQRFNALAALGKKSFDVVVYEALGINWKTKILQRVSNIKGALITRLVALKHKAGL